MRLKHKVASQVRLMCKVNAAEHSRSAQSYQSRDKIEVYAFLLFIKSSSTFGIDFLSPTHHSQLYESLLRYFHFQWQQSLTLYLCSSMIKENKKRMTVFSYALNQLRVWPFSLFPRKRKIGKLQNFSHMEQQFRSELL